MSKAVKRRTRVRLKDLRWSCPSGCMKFESTDTVAPVQGTIGQDRALKALKLGLELYSPGYNIYVSGLVGTGRTTTVKELLREISPKCAIPRDRAYVRNFEDRDRPRLLTFQPIKAEIRTAPILDTIHARATSWMILPPNASPSETSSLPTI